MLPLSLVITVFYAFGRRRQGAHTKSLSQNGILLGWQLNCHPEMRIFIGAEVQLPPQLTCFGINTKDAPDIWLTIDTISTYSPQKKGIRDLVYAHRNRYALLNRSVSGSLLVE